MDDLKERLEILASRNSEPLTHVPTTYQMQDDELLIAFEELLENGEVPETAAETLGKTSRWFRKFRSEKSPSYDEEHCKRYQEIMRPDGLHRERLLGKIRQASIKAALDGNVRAQEKWLMALDPEFSFLKPAQFLGDNYNVDKLMIVLGDLPTPLLQQMRDTLAAQKALPDIDATQA